MNIFKKTAVMLTATLATLGISVAIVSQAAGDLDWFPSSNSYNTTESPNYYDGCYNSGDTSWTTNVQYKRHKNSDSSMYIYNTSDRGATVTFWGLKSGGTYKYCCSSLSGSQYEGKYASQGWVPNGREQWIVNYVNERGCQYACIKVQASSSGVKGYWSPDCVGTYDICNFHTP